MKMNLKDIIAKMHQGIKKLNLKNNAAIFLMLSACFATSMIAIFGFGMNYFDNDVAVTADAIARYLKENNEEKTYGEIEFLHSSVNFQSAVPANFVRSVTASSSYEKTNRTHYIVKSESDFQPLQFLDSGTILSPNVLVFPTLTVSNNVFDISLMNEQKFIDTQSPGEIYISKDIADNYILNKKLVANDYDALIKMAINGKTNKIDSSFDYEYRIAGVIDTTKSNYDFYRGVFGETLVIANKNSLHDNFTKNLRIMFELGTSNDANESFLKLINKKFSSNNYKCHLYEKDSSGVYVEGKILESVVYARNFFNLGKATNKAYIYLSISLTTTIGFMLLLSWAIFYRKKRGILNKTEINALVFILCFVEFVVIALILLAGNGQSIGAGYYIPHDNSVASIFLIVYFALFYIMALFTQLFSSNKIKLKK